MNRAIVLVLFGLVASSGLAAPAADSPEAFLKHLYSGYDPGRKPVAFVYPDARPIVDKSMLALLRRDEKLSKGEVGALDADPICQCQDWGRFKVLSIHVRSTGRARASGDVAFTNLSDHNTVHFDLVFEDGGWKIHDLGSRDTPSMQAYLRHYKY